MLLPKDPHFEKADKNLPPGCPGWISTELIENTLRTWQPFSTAPLTTDDALEMIVNLSQLFEAVGITEPQATEKER